MKNYSKLVESAKIYVSEINYNDLIEVTGKVPIDLHKKLNLNLIRSVELTAKVEDGELIQFLKECKNLKNLKLKHTSFGECF